MSARIINFPGNPRPRKARAEAALVLILPTRRIDYDLPAILDALTKRELAELDDLLEMEIV